MSSIMQAYSAVHSTEVKEELDSNRDQISEMRLTQFTDKDLYEVAEEILEGIFTEGSSVAQAQHIIESIFDTSDIPGRQQKIERLQEAFASVISKVKEKSARTAIESFGEYRKAKSVGEAWVNKFDHDKGNIRLHDTLIAQDRLVIKTGLLQMIEKAKSPAAEEEKLRKDDDLFGSPNQRSSKKRKNPKTGVWEITREDKKWGYDSKGKSLNPADKEEEEREDDELFGSPNAKKKGKKVKKEEVELEEKDTYDQVAAVIDMYRSKKGSDEANRLTRQGKTGAAKKEREYAAFERQKMKRDAQRSGHPWEHAKGSTTEKEGKKSEKTKHVRDPQYNSYEPEGNVIDESGSAIKDPTVKQPLKKELKDLRKGIKGNAVGIKDADAVSQVGEDKNWIQGAVKRPGAFTKKAKAAGKTVQQFAKEVDDNPDKFSTRTKRQANLAQTFASMKKEGYDFDAIEEGLTKEGYPQEEIIWVMANGI